MSLPHVVQHCAVESPPTNSEQHGEANEPQPVQLRPASEPPLLPEHFALIAAFLATDKDSGTWRAVSQATKNSANTKGPHYELLEEAGKKALAGLERRKQLRKILMSARQLVAGLNRWT